MIFWIYWINSKHQSPSKISGTCYIAHGNQLLCPFCDILPTNITPAPRTKCDLAFFSKTLSLPSTPFPQIRGTQILLFSLFYSSRGC